MNFERSHKSVERGRGEGTQPNWDSLKEVPFRPLTEVIDDILSDVPNNHDDKETHSKDLDMQGDVEGIATERALRGDPSKEKELEELKRRIEEVAAFGRNKDNKSDITSGPGSFGKRERSPLHTSDSNYEEDLAKILNDF